ncbi:hypothetical protein D0Z66_16085 [Cereibacter sphaeroides]|nr:hypothetical protein D0Z66_16085 [Cereibacter sphaeroides]
MLPKVVSIFRWPDAGRTTLISWLFPAMIAGLRRMPGMSRRSRQLRRTFLEAPLEEADAARLV